MKYKTHIIAAVLTLLFVPTSALAAAPSPVTNVSAIVENGEVTVEWDAVTSDPIEYYRVYYSSESILDNNGLYDDFEVTENDDTFLTFIPPSGMDTLYIAVIAVTTGGMESEFFTEEAMVDLSSLGALPVVKPTSVQSSSSESSIQQSTSSSSAVDSSSAKLLKGTVVSPTEIVVEFSVSMTVEASKAPQNLSIEAPGGKNLPITSITIKGKTITIYTDTQTKGTVYNVRFGDAFTGKAGQPLDADDRSVLLSGHNDGKVPVHVPAVREVNLTSPPDLANATIIPQVQPNGAYTVTIKWDALDNTPGDLYGIVAYQTRDGQSFGPPSLLPIEIGGVQLQNVTPGFFGIYLQVANVYGYVSPGVFQYVTLPAYVPGYGFQGDLTFGGMQQEEDVQFDAVETDDSMATIEVITDDTPLHTIDGVDHSSAMEESVPHINWKNAALLASSVAVLMIVLVGGFAVLAKRHSSVQ